MALDFTKTQERETGWDEGRKGNSNCSLLTFLMYNNIFGSPSRDPISEYSTMIVPVKAFLKDEAN